MKRMNFLSGCTLMVAGWIGVVAPTFGAETVQRITLINSGTDANADGRDDGVFVATSSGDARAYVLTQVPGSYSSPIGSSRWIGPTPTAGIDAGVGTVRFKTHFSLPTSFNNASATFAVHADNYARVYLNGTQIGVQTQAAVTSNFQAPAEVFSTNAGLRAGMNEVWIDLYNHGGPAALDFDIRVAYSAVRAEFVQPEADAQIIPGEYVVVFKDNVTDVSARAQRLAAASGGTLLELYNEPDGLKGFSLALTQPHLLEQIQLDDGVEWVEHDLAVRAQAVTQLNPGWGLDRLDQRAIPLDASFTYLRTGRGVNVYVVDSGINTGLAEFQGRATAVFDNVRGDDRGGQDCTGHGTAMAALIGSKTYGVAKQANLISVRVLDCDNWTKMSRIASAINWLTKNGRRPAVVNMSLGDSKHRGVDKAVEKSVAKGFVYVVAAGNSYKDACTQSPARVGAAITVGASDLTGSPQRESLWWDSISGNGTGWGGCVDLFAPGRSVATINLHGQARVDTGSSIATALVSGAAAAYLQDNPAVTPAHVSYVLAYNSTKNVFPWTKGSPNQLLNTSFLNIPPPPAVHIAGQTWSTGGPPVRLTAVASPSASYYYTWIEERCVSNPASSYHGCWTQTYGPVLNGTTYDIRADYDWRYSTMRVQIRSSVSGPVLAEGMLFVDGPAT